MITANEALTIASRFGFDKARASSNAGYLLMIGVQMAQQGLIPWDESMADKLIPVLEKLAKEADERIEAMSEDELDNEALTDELERVRGFASLDKDAKIERARLEYCQRKAKALFNDLPKNASAYRQIFDRKSKGQVIADDLLSAL